MLKWINQFSKVFIITAILAAALISRANASEYQITINTSALSGSSDYLDFQFNAGTTAAPAAQATVSNFTSDATIISNPSGVPVNYGSVSGTLPNNLTFTNASVDNEVMQSATLGNTITFDVSFSGAFQTATCTSTCSDTEFSVSLLDGNYNGLLTNDPNGTVVNFQLAPGGGITTTTYNTATGGPSVVSVTPVPLPPAFLLFLSGLSLLLVMKGRAFAAFISWRGNNGSAFKLL